MSHKTIASARRRILITLTCWLSVISVTANAGWEVQWIDKFEGTGVDWSKWTAQTQANYNNEIQCYTDDDQSELRNYEVSDGSLKIIARRMDIACPGLGGEQRTWTSGRLNSKDKGEFLYGRLEARIRFLELKGGTWPAFWMLENRIAEQPIKGDNDNVPWPNPGAGEIDVWEWYANNGDSYITNFFNIHSCGGEFRHPYPGGAPDVMTYHTYAIEWDADQITFFMDNEPIVTRDLSSCPQYEEPMFALLNVAIGGNLGGALDPELTTATMEVDYLAYCIPAENNDFDSCNEQTPMVEDDDGDGIGNSRDNCPDTPPNTEVGADGCEIRDSPVQPAPDPTLPEDRVISLFSDSYQNINGIDYNPDWGQATSVDIIQIEGNNILKYSNLNYQGTDFDGNRQDVTGMDNLHLDYWTSTSSVLKFFLISPGPVETAFAFDIQKSEWQQLTIPLSTFTNVDLSNTFQLKVEGNGTVFFDNIYFSRSADSDGDGIGDDNDQCPNTPAGAEVDQNGCAVEANVAPTLTLAATQAGAQVTRISATAGTVTVAVTINDENAGDSHQVDWSAPSLPSFSTTATTLSFDPAGISASQIVVSAIATDSGQPALTAESSIALPIERATEQQSSVTSSGSLSPLMSLYLLALIVLRRSKKLV